jgi:hypothetical protein
MKPQMRTETGITLIMPDTRHIGFDATPDAASEFSEFGQLEKIDWMGENHYHLYVDARFNFEEVVTYIQNYGAE